MKILEKLKSSKALVLTAGSVLATVSANAAVSYDPTAGFSGDFDLTPFYSAVGIVVGAVAVVAAVKLAIGMFRRV